MRRRAVIAAGAASILSGCLGGRSSGDTDFDVGMGSSFYRPEELRVGRGETVVWRNTGARRHTVTAYEDGIPDGAAYFASGGDDTESAARDAWERGNGALDPGETFEHTFEVSGTYDYFCIPHVRMGMEGRVVVE
jgi:plastocyanin